MNIIEQEHIKDLFGENSNKTMEDYFANLEIMLAGAINKNELKIEFKRQFPDESDWSF
tara:strand:- start:27237 stop:27410 length:174 start_codon:yes stop_codon:yes gene_type:complete